jgi:predicted homoserine dehydrogenase-like protein
VHEQALRKLRARASAGTPLRVGVVGAGTFGQMLLAQARRLDGLEVVAVADLDPERAREAMVTGGWDPQERAVTDVAGVLERRPEVVVEATGAPLAGIGHAEAAIAAGCHVVMVTVEADVLAGPLLAERARSAGVVYSLAYGDQPALICELVGWARAAGLDVVCAGKGTKHLPAYHAITPDTVWESYGLSGEQIADGGFSARMFTSFIDGTKSAVEMAAVCNATGLEPQRDGLRFPPCPANDLARVCVPRASGGVLGRERTVEVISCLDEHGQLLGGDLRWGVFVVFESPDRRTTEWLRAYGIQTSEDGRYGALYRPYHLIGLETTVSILSAGLLGEPTGSPDALRADVVAIAKRDLSAGEVLDGEGGFSVYGALRPLDDAEGMLPVGLAEAMRLSRPVTAGSPVALADLVQVPEHPALALRR